MYAKSFTTWSNPTGPVAPRSNDLGNIVYPPMLSDARKRRPSALRASGNVHIVACHLAPSSKNQEFLLLGVADLQVPRFSTFALDPVVSWLHTDLDISS